jgi:preprotein translocase subunit SecD
MKRIKWGQLGVILVIIGISCSSIYYRTSNGRKVRYGLDLQGGVHIVLQAEQIALTETTPPATTPTNTTKDTGKTTPPADSKTTPTDTTTPPVTPPATTTEVNKGITNADLAGPVPVTKADLERALSVIEKRVNALGVGETSISTQGNDRIIVDIPGYTDIEQAKSIIGKIAVLTFKDESGKIIVSGKNLKNATFAYQTVSQGGVREPVVQLEWDEAGKKMFADGTAANIGKTIKIFLDDEEIMAPKVNEAIKDGNAVITFGGSKNEDAVKSAQQYAALLRGGSLPLKMTFIEERIVGPSLGRDTINKSILGAIIACLAIMLYMIFYYRMLGLIGSFALILYVFMYLGFLLGINAVFSLPAIGAVVLSLGGAVDSNIIVFERIREEYATGRTMLSSVGSGYVHGWSAIFDSNFSILIAMGALYWLGTPTIKGFAITTIVGVFAALITSYFFSQFMLNVIAINYPKVNEKLFGLKKPEERR